MIRKEDSGFTVKSNNIFLLTSIMTLVFFVVGLGMIFVEMVPYFSEYESFDFFGFGFMCFWTTAVFLMSLFSFSEYSKRIEISSKGIACSTVFKKKALEWREIRDYGLSYGGQVRGGGNLYYLYFSKDILEQRGKYRKKINKKTIKVSIMYSEYEIAVSEIIAFCKSKITVEPFIAEDAFHLI